MMNHNHSGHGDKHLLIMVLCCLGPLALVLVLVSLGIGGRALFPLVLLICPLSMVFMMMGMRRGPASPPQQDKDAMHEHHHSESETR